MHDQLSLDDFWLSFLAMIHSNVSKARRVAFSIGRTREVSFPPCHILRSQLPKAILGAKKAQLGSLREPSN